MQANCKVTVMYNAAKLYNHAILNKKSDLKRHDEQVIQNLFRALTLTSEGRIIGETNLATGAECK